MTQPIDMNGAESAGSAGAHDNAAQSGQDHPNSPNATAQTSADLNAASRTTAPHEPDNDLADTAKDNKMFDAARFKILKEAAQSRIDELENEVEKFKGEAAEHKDRSLRLMAEMENLRRRTEREKNDMAKFGISKFARDVLSVADNVQRAIDSVPKDAIGQDEALKNFVEGIQLTERELLTVLERHGVRRIDPTGERFDPNFHQAMMEVDNPDVPVGTIVTVFQPAYVIEDRVLRPALVVTAKGGPKATKPDLDVKVTPATATGEMPGSELPPE